MRTRIQALPLPQAEALRRAVIDSPYLAGTTLNMRFASTWGFSVAFRREGLAKLRKTFPDYVPYFELVMERGYNAFFLNPLVIFRGGSVDAHVDCSLRSYTQPLEPPCPGKVSVFYAQVPEGLEGGELLLSDARGKELGRVKPLPNMLVQFDGELMHRVTPFEGSNEALEGGSRGRRSPPLNLELEGGPRGRRSPPLNLELEGGPRGRRSPPLNLVLERSRVSLVCEHYRLDPALLIRVPEFHLETSRGFDEFFDKALETQGMGNEA